MNVLHILKWDHRRVDELFEHIASSNGQRKREYFDELESELKEHAKLEEKYFYPELKKHGMTRKQAEHSYEEHHDVDEMLDDLDDLSMEDPGWDTLFERLRDSVQHHVYEEENDLFPKVEQTIDQEKLEDMGNKILQKKKKKYQSLLEKAKHLFKK